MSSKLFSLLLVLASLEALAGWRAYAADAPWVKEPEDLLMAELAWLNALSLNEKNLTIVISHDDEQRRRYLEQGLLGDQLQ